MMYSWFIAELSEQEKQCIAKLISDGIEKDVHDTSLFPFLRINVIYNEIMKKISEHGDKDTVTVLNTLKQKIENIYK